MSDDMSPASEYYGMYHKEAVKNHELRKINAEMLEALGNLVGEQNGPPLIRYEHLWQNAMDKAQEILAKAKGESNGNSQDELQA